MTPEEVKSALQRQLASFLVAATLPDKHPDKRAVASAFVNTLRPRHVEFLRAAVAHPYSREQLEDGKPIHEFIINTPARWVFEHIIAIGTVQDAWSLAGRYRVASGFRSVAPLGITDAYSNARCIPYFHKETSPYRMALERRMQLKAQLGSFRSLVGRAKKMNKTEFLAHWRAKKGEEVRWMSRKRDPRTRQFHPEVVIQNKTMKDLADHKLMERTGYTPEQFWYEVNNPGSVTPKPPQFTDKQLLLLINDDSQWQ